VEHHCCQITAASIAIAACACICNGSAARWERGDAFRLTAAACLVLNSGEAAVAVLLEACDKPVPDDALYGMLDVCSKAQVTMMSSTLAGLGDDAAAAAFAATTARPAVLLRWLGTATCALELAMQAGGTPGGASSRVVQWSAALQASPLPQPVPMPMPGSIARLSLTQPTPPVLPCLCSQPPVYARRGASALYRLGEQHPRPARVPAACQGIGRHPLPPARGRQHAAAADPAGSGSSAGGREQPRPA
jgi:hypothetical protein